LREWDIQDQIITTYFDTLASHTGYRSGAGCFVEQELNKDLPFLSCYYMYTALHRELQGHCLCPAPFEIFPFPKEKSLRLCTCNYLGYIQDNFI